MGLRLVNLNPAPTLGEGGFFPSIRIDLAASGLTSLEMRFSRKTKISYSEL